ncbi:MAG TPA: carboxypeptidase regulatory-like domain-containing protein [Gemmatimonadaceae bacterium]
MPCPASAQSGSVTGVVVGADSQPVPLAYVGIVGTTLSTTASSTGQFVLVSVPTGRRLLDVRRLGYTPLQLPIDVRSADTLHLQVRLLPVAFELDTVAVANEGSAALRAFEERRARGPGVFFTRDEIERMQPRQVTDVLRRVPGIQVRPVNGTYGDNVFVTMRGSRCSMMFYVNGSPLPTAQDVPINNYIAVEEVVAVEVYAPSEMPPQFNSTRFNARCGLVGIWTRSGR